MVEYVNYYQISNDGTGEAFKDSPNEYGYHIIRLCPDLNISETQAWIVETLAGKWTWFGFGRDITYCFYDEEDAFAFKMAWI